MTTTTRPAWLPSRVLPWVVGAAGLCLAVTTFEFRDPDVWWHLAVGRLITAHGIPAAEPLSFAGAPNPWVGQQWLYEVGLARLVDLGGTGLAMLVMGALGALAVAVGALATRREEPVAGPAAAAAVVTGALLAASVLGVRGQVLTVLFSAVTLVALTRWREGSTRALAALPPLVVLWANLHAGVVTGLALVLLVGLAVAVHRAAAGPGSEPGARLRPLWLTLLLCGAATLVTPAGPHLWTYIAATFTNPTLTNGITEWQSPDFHSFWLRATAAAVILVLAGWTWSGRADWVDSVLLGAAVAATLQAQRNVALLAVVLVPRMAVLLTVAGRGLQTQRGSRGRAAPRRPRPPAPAAVLWAGAAIVTVATLVATVLPATRPARTAEWERQNEPAAAAAWLLEHDPDAHVYSTYEWGGYLAERFAPRRMVWIYGESAVFGDARLTEYLDVHDLAASWRAVLARNGMHVAVLPGGSREAVALAEIGWTVGCADRDSGAVVLEEGPTPARGAAPPAATDAPRCGVGPTSGPPGGHPSP